MIHLLHQSREEVILLTGNRKDFGDGTGLHPDLMKEVEDKIRLPHRLRLLPTLRRFNDEVIVPKLESLKEVAQEISEDKEPSFSLRGWIETDLLNELRSGEWEESLVPLAPGTVTTYLLELRNIKSATIDQAKLLPLEDVYLEGRTTLEVSISVMADLDQYEEYEEVRCFFGWGDEIPSDMSVEHVADAEVRFAVILKSDGMVPSAWSIIGVKNIQ